MNLNLQNALQKFINTSSVDLSITDHITVSSATVLLEELYDLNEREFISALFNAVNELRNNSYTPKFDAGSTFILAHDAYRAFHTDMNNTSKLF